MNDRIEQSWRGFEAAALPETAGPTQRAEMRKAFYAGATGLFAVLVGSDVDATEDEYKVRLCEVSDELEVFQFELEAEVSTSPRGQG